MSFQVQVDAAFQRLQRYTMLQTEVRLLLIATDEVSDALEDLQLDTHSYRQSFGATRRTLMSLSRYCNLLIATTQQDIQNLYSQNAWHANGHAW